MIKFSFIDIKEDVHNNGDNIMLMASKIQYYKADLRIQCNYNQNPNNVCM